MDFLLRSFLDDTRLRNPAQLEEPARQEGKIFHPSDVPLVSQVFKRYFICIMAHTLTTRRFGSQSCLHPSFSGMSRGDGYRGRSGEALIVGMALTLKWAVLSLIVGQRCRRFNERGSTVYSKGNGRSVSPGRGAQTIILITAGKLAAGQKKKKKKTLPKGQMSVSMCVYLPPRLSHARHFCISH